MRKKRLFASILIIYIALFVAMPIRAETRATGAASISSTDERPIQLPEGIVELSNLLSEADKAVTSADEKTNAILSIEIEYEKDDSLGDRIAGSQKKIKKRLAQQALNLSFLTRETESWKKDADEIDLKYNVAVEQISEIEKLKVEFKQSISIWEKNRDYYKKSKPAGVPTDAIQKVLSAYKSDTEKLDKKLAEFFDLQEKINADKSLIEDHLDYLVSNGKDFTASMWYKDSPTVFDPAFLKSIADANPGDIKGRWADYVGEMREYFPNVRAKFAFEILFLLIILFVMRGVEISILRRAAEVPEVAELAHFFKNKLSIALLLVLIPAKFLHPEPPVLLQEIYWFLLSVSVMLLLMRLITERTIEKFIFGIWVASVFDVTRTLLSGSYVLERLGIVLQAVLGLCVTLIFLNPNKLQSEQFKSGTRGHKILKKVRVAIAFLLLIALVAELLGDHNAALFFCTGAFKSVYATFFLIALTRLLKYFTIYTVYSTIARKLNIFKNYNVLIVNTLDKIFSYLAALLWIYLVAVIWDFDSELTYILGKFFGAGFNIGENKISIGVVLGAFLAIYLMGKISRFLRFALDQDVYPRKNINQGLGGVIDQSIKYTFGLIGGIIALSILGFKLENIAIVAGALGVGIGFGLQNIVNNFVSGIIMLAERPIKLGDIIETGGVIGTVRHIGIRATRIETFNASEIIVPNGDLLWGSLVNWTHTIPHQRIVISVGVAYSTDPKKAIEALENVAKNHPEVMKEPPLGAFFINFGESSLDFELRCFVASMDVKAQIETELRVAIVKAFKEAGIEIPFPQRDINIRSMQGVGIEKK